MEEKKKKAFENKKNALRDSISNFRERTVDSRGRLILNDEETNKLPSRRNRELK